MREGHGRLREVVDALRDVALAADDAGGHFPAMYARVTASVAASVDAGAFDDGPRMARFAARFAGWYLGPRHGDPAPPGCWRAAFDVEDDGRLLIVQHLLLGINAHVNHDLPQVVVEAADDAGDLRSMRPDFEAINDVLAATYPLVLRDLSRMTRWVNLAARWGGERAFRFSLDAARDQAWRTAVRLHPLGPEARRAERAELDRLVRVLAHLVARPGQPVAAVAAVARRLEQKDPRAVTVALLGPLA